MTKIMDKIQPDDRRKGLKYIILEQGFVNVYVAIAYGFVMVLFAKELGASSIQIGVLSSLPSLTMILSIPTAYFVEKTGTRKQSVLVFVTMEILFRSSIFAIPYFTGDPKIAVPVLLVLLFLAFSCSSIGNTAWLPWQADIVPHKVRGRYFSKLHVVCRISNMVTLFYAGWVLDRFSANYTGYTIVMVTALVFGLSAMVLLWQVPGSPANPEIGKDTKFLYVVTEPLKQIKFRKYLLFSAVFGIGSNMTGPFMIIFMNKDLGISKTSISTYTIIGSVAFILSMRLWGHLADKFGNKPVLKISVIGSACCSLLWLLTKYDTRILIPVISFAGGIFGSANMLTVTNLLLEVVPDNYRSVYTSNYRFLSSFFTGFAPIAAGYIMVLNLSGIHLNMPNIYYLCILASVILMISILFLKGVETTGEKTTMDLIKNIFTVNPARIIFDVFFPRQTSEK